MLFRSPEKIKAELARNGWHQVASGPARIIDASNEEWTVVEEENYEKANKPIGAKDETEKNFKIYVKNAFGAYKVADWPAVSKEAAVKEFLEANPAYRNKGIIEARDSATQDSKEQLFTIEYEQDGVMHVRKVRASSIEDAISKVKSQDAGALPSSVWQHGSVYVNASSQITGQKNCKIGRASCRERVSSPV